MTANELLQKIILGDITLSQGLMLSKVMYKDLLSESSYQWICNELEHYNDPKQLPDYRILDCDLKVQISDYFFGSRIETLDTSVINRQIDDKDMPYASPNKMLVRQGVESIENSIGEIGGSVNMFLPSELIKLVMKYYTYPKGVRIEKMFQECRVEQIKNIIPCVRNKLITILQTEVQQPSTIQNDIMKMSCKKRIFISYGWDDESHCDWVRSLAGKLKNFFEVDIDVKAPLGSDINVFMEQRISSADRVLLILTPKYKEKADARQNGVGYESVLISTELYNNQGSNKFIPIVRKGSVSESFPIYLGSRKGLIMTEQVSFESAFEELVEDLKNN